MPITYMKKITRQYVKAHPECTFIFGDNDQRMGLGGQAGEMRGESNCIGVRTKKAPNNLQNSYYSDDEIEDNLEKINDDFAKIELELVAGKTVVFPEDGIGVGLAEMPTRCLATYMKLCSFIKELESDFG